MTDDLFIREGAEGMRHNWLLGQVMRTLGDRPDVTWNLLLASARQASFAFCRPPVGDREIEEICKWGWAKTHDRSEEQRPLTHGWSKVRIADVRPGDFEALIDVCEALEVIRLRIVSRPRISLDTLLADL